MLESFLQQLNKNYKCCRWFDTSMHELSFCIFLLKCDFKGSWKSHTQHIHTQHTRTQHIPNQHTHTRHTPTPTHSAHPYSVNLAHPTSHHQSSWVSPHFPWTNSTVSSWWKLWYVEMNYLYTFTCERVHVLCSIKFNKVCLQLLSYLKSLGHINIPPLLALYGENVGLYVLQKGTPWSNSVPTAETWQANIFHVQTSHTVEIYILKSLSSSDYSTPVVTLHYCQTHTQNILFALQIIPPISLPLTYPVQRAMTYLHFHPLIG